MKTLKKFAIMLMAIVIMASVVPAYTEAATTPTCVEKALKRAVNENNWCIVIRQDKGKMYIYKKCKSGWKLKKTFNCIVGKRMCNNKHYFLHRSSDIDIFAWGVDNDRWSYGMYIDCYEKAYTNMIHSYTDHYNGKTWKTRKCAKWNTDGISICENNAKWIWNHCGDGTAIQVIGK